MSRSVRLRKLTAKCCRHGRAQIEAERSTGSRSGGYSDATGPSSHHRGPMDGCHWGSRSTPCVVGVMGGTQVQARRQNQETCKSSAKASRSWNPRDSARTRKARSVSILPQNDECDRKSRGILSMIKRVRIARPIRRT